MKIRWRLSALALALSLAASMAIGCAATPETTPMPTPEPTSSATDSTFTLSILPTAINGFTIAGQKVVFLVTFKEDAPSGQTVLIAATADGANLTVDHPSIKAGEVAEVVVVPDSQSVGKTITVDFSGSRGSQGDTQSFSFDVIEGEDDRQAYAQELQGRFIAWLAAAHPELKIGPDTVWEGTMVSPQWLVVSHYLFFSAEWEMHIEWHIMVAPYDWVRIDLRHRYDQTRPSYAFEIASVSANGEPVAIDVPESIWR